MARIPISEWARRHGITPASARQKAQRGGFKTAEKIGTVWLIEEAEPHISLPRGRPFKAGQDARRNRLPE